MPTLQQPTHSARASGELDHFVVSDALTLRAGGCVTAICGYDIPGVDYWAHLNINLRTPLGGICKHCIRLALGGH